MIKKIYVWGSNPRHAKDRRYYYNSFSRAVTVSTTLTSCESTTTGNERPVSLRPDFLNLIFFVTSWEKLTPIEISPLPNRQGQHLSTLLIQATKHAKQIKIRTINITT
uniref:Uncharacterized protein n=1 Tax=Cacopsylla melanoneura TaxID=428564 RepID=A0A8D8RQB4_9HEMI